MRKVLACALAALTLFVPTACGGDEPKPQPTDVAVSDSPTPSPSASESPSPSPMPSVSISPSPTRLALSSNGQAILNRLTQLRLRQADKPLGPSKVSGGETNTTEYAGRVVETMDALFNRAFVAAGLPPTQVYMAGPNTRNACTGMSVTPDSQRLEYCSTQQIGGMTGVIFVPHNTLGAVWGNELPRSANDVAAAMVLGHITGLHLVDELLDGIGLQASLKATVLTADCFSGMGFRAMMLKLTNVRLMPGMGVVSNLTHSFGLTDVQRMQAWQDGWNGTPRGCLKYLG